VIKPVNVEELSEDVRQYRMERARNWQGDLSGPYLPKPKPQTLHPE